MKTIRTEKTPLGIVEYWPHCDFQRCEEVASACLSDMREIVDELKSRDMNLCKVHLLEIAEHILELPGLPPVGQRAGMHPC